MIDYWLQRILFEHKPMCRLFTRLIKNAATDTVRAVAGTAIAIGLGAAGESASKFFKTKPVALQKNSKIQAIINGKNL